MNICGVNFFDGEKGRRVEKQLKEIKKIFLSNNKSDFNIIYDYNNIGELVKYDFLVSCGDVKITFKKELISKYNNIKLSKKPRLIRDVTYLRIIPKIRNLDVNFFPRFTWNSILPDDSNFPYDSGHNRWIDIKKKYNLTIKDYQTQGDNILFLLQIPTDASLNDLNFNGDGYLIFMIKTINEILKHTDRKIILRSHPLNKNNDIIAKFLLNHFNKTNKLFLSQKDMLDEDLQNVKCVISYNSSSTVEALFNGINVINLSRKQPCFSGASNKISDIENLNELDREDFLKKISFLHWESDELDSSENKKYLYNLLIKSMSKNTIV